MAGSLDRMYCNHQGVDCECCITPAWHIGHLRLSLRVIALACLFCGPLYGAERLALLIGNQDCAAEVGRLERPLDDIDRVGAALKQVGFGPSSISKVKNSDLGETQRAINQYVRRLREPGDDAIGFLYITPW